MFEALSKADIFSGQLHMRLGLGMFRGVLGAGSSNFSKFGEASFSTPVDELFAASGKA